MSIDCSKEGEVYMTSRNISSVKPLVIVSSHTIGQHVILPVVAAHKDLVACKQTQGKCRYEESNCYWEKFSQ